MKLIGTGRESKAFLIDNESVILIGQNKTAFSNYKNQKITLDILQDKIDFIKIPQNATLISPCEKYPYGALDISYVEGITPELNILNTQEKLKLGKQIA